MGDQSKRHLHRLHLGAAAILSLSDAAALLPIGDADARAWLRESGLVRQLQGRHVVAWADVLAAIHDLPALDEQRGKRSHNRWRWDGRDD